jgi:RNA polymerase sigma factor (sigma-70 family)
MLDQPWPEFLNLLDQDANAAFQEFYQFLYKLLTVRPPQGMRSLSETESEDLLQEIVLHCVQDDFRVLRQYRPQGRPFAAWLYVLAHNKCLDCLRRRSRSPELHSQFNYGVGEDSLGGGVDSDLTPEKRAGLRDVISTVKGCLSRLRQYCRLLLQLAAEEYTPREMVLLLGWPPDKNKKVSDDLRECRRQLRKVMVEEGIDVESVLQA